VAPATLPTRTRRLTICPSGDETRRARPARRASRSGKRSPPKPSNRLEVLRIARREAEFPFQRSRSDECIGHRRGRRGGQRRQAAARKRPPREAALRNDEGWAQALSGWRSSRRLTCDDCIEKVPADLGLWLVSQPPLSQVRGHFPRMVSGRYPMQIGGSGLTQYDLGWVVYRTIRTVPLGVEPCLGVRTYVSSCPPDDGPWCAVVGLGVGTETRRSRIYETSWRPGQYSNGCGSPGGTTRRPERRHRRSGTRAPGGVLGQGGTASRRRSRRWSAGLVASARPRRRPAPSVRR
jgi:hypothetical protein